MMLSPIPLCLPGRPGFNDRLNAVGEHFYAGFQALVEHSGVPLRFGLYFGVWDEVTNYRQAACKDRALEHGPGLANTSSARRPSRNP